MADITWNNPTGAKKQAFPGQYFGSEKERQQYTPYQKPKTFDYQGAKKEGATDAEIEAFVAQKNAEGFPTVIDKGTASRTKEATQSFFKSIPEAAKKRYGNIEQNIDESMARMKPTEGVPSWLGNILEGAKTGVLTMGEIAGFVSDVGGEFVKGAIKSNVGEADQEVLKAAAGGAMQTPLPQAAMKGYGEFKEAYPQTAKFGEAVVNLATLPAGGSALKTGTKLAGEAGEQALKTGGKVVGGVTSSAKKGAVATAEFTGPKINSATKRVMQQATGITPEKAKIWSTAAEKTPDMMETAKRAVSTNPQTPHYAYGVETVDRINSIRDEAKNAMTTAIEKARVENPNRVFQTNDNVLNRFNSALKDSGLKIEGGTPRTSLSGETTYSPMRVVETGQIKHMNADDLAKLSKIADDIRKPNLTLDDVLALDNVIKTFDNYTYTSDNPFLRKLGKSLSKSTSETIDEWLPEVDAANKLYQKYYTARDLAAGKIMDKSGEFKQGGETFLANLGGANKGVSVNDMKKLGEILGRDIVTESQLVSLAKEFTSAVGATQRNRVWDIIVGITGGGALSGIATAGVLNPASWPLVAGFLITNAMSSPVRYGRLLEWLGKVRAGKLNKTGLQKAAQGFSNEEKALLEEAVRKASTPAPVE